jgi:hypothetical protein
MKCVLLACGLVSFALSSISHGEYKPIEIGEESRPQGVSIEYSGEVHIASFEGVSIHLTNGQASSEYDVAYIESVKKLVSARLDNLRNLLISGDSSRIYFDANKHPELVVENKIDNAIQFLGCLDNYHEDLCIKPRSGSNYTRPLIDDESIFPYLTETYIKSLLSASSHHM